MNAKLISTCPNLLSLQELEQAIAYAQAELDQDRKHFHRLIDHPDMKVLWHRADKLRRVMVTAWDHFKANFPLQLVVPKAVQEEVRCMEDPAASAAAAAAAAAA